MAAAAGGRLVLITGASDGIGRAAARSFAERGDRVLAVARREEELRSLAAEYTEASRIEPLPADVAQADSMEALARRVLGDFGPPDVIVANAGIGLDALFTETSDAMLRSVFEVNVFGLARTVRPYLPAMIERGSGRILLVSSVVGKRGIPFYSAYSASKFAVHGLADALRPELLRSGVSVGVICPSSTATGFRDRMRREGPGQSKKRFRRHSPESVAAAIVRMAGSRRREAVLSLEGKLMCLAAALIPGILDRILARVLGSRGRPAARARS